ncbi:MAG: PQQ-binding-like beta-propeller repeat protein [Sedimentisphaerales bacterium]|nr:PQQ-binding-like beta-propeller repeat protein [Sedimentisphaerales bacterium]
MRRLFCAMLMVSLSCTVLAENWPCWRGPGRQGISSETNIPVQWSASENIAWKTPIPGQGYSSPIVWDDKVFLTTATQEGKSYCLICLDRKTGQVVWDKPIVQQRTDHKQPNNSWATSTPVTDGKTVYCVAADGTISAVAFEGSILWQHKEFEYYSEHGLGVSPVLHGGLVIVAYDWSSAGPDKKLGWQTPWDQSVIVAVDTASGKVRWRGKRGLSRIGHVTPQVVQAEGIEQLVSGAGDVVQGFDIKTGGLLWTVRGSGEGVVPSIVAGDGLVFATTGFGESQIQAIRPGGQGDVTDTHLAWKTGEDVPKVPSMLYRKPYLYVVTDEGIMKCLEAATGKEIYRERIRGRFWPSPIWADGKLYLLSDKGETTVIKDGPSFEIVGTSDLNDKKCLASPAISQGCIFIRGAESLYCIGKP